MNELEVPTCISLESWEAYVEVRKRKGQRAPLTDYAAKLIWKDLLEADRQGYDAQHMLDKSIKNGWTGVFIGADTPRKNRAIEETRQHLERQAAVNSKPSPEVRERLLSLGSKAIRRVA